jgi:hypothetical protein
VVTADIDMAKLQRSLKAAAGAFGESNKQALVRWSIQTCRELAYSTQVFGRSKTKGKQEGAILADALRLILVRRKGERIDKKRALKSEDEVNEYLDKNMPKRRRKKAAPLPIEDRMECSEAIFKKAMRRRYQRAGMAKGGFIGAGQDIAKRQTGQGRINIGKNVLGYAQKHTSFGSASLSSVPTKPLATLKNRAKHTSTNYVLKTGAETQASRKALPPTIRWYKSALRTKLGP